MPSRSLSLRILFAGVLSIFLAGLGILAPFSRANAQTASSPYFLITWKASGSYIPSFYEGKALPTYGSEITASLELIAAGGKTANLSQQTIYWYLNNNLIGGGTGVQQVTFSPVGVPPSTMNLRVTLPSYNGNYLVHTIQIPMVTPEAVVYAPYPNQQFSANPLVLQAFPFFFNIADPTQLSYSWSVNNQTGSSAENPEIADITVPQGTQSGSLLNVSLNINNPNDSTVGTASANLTYENQL